MCGYSSSYSTCIQKDSILAKFPVANCIFDSKTHHFNFSILLVNKACNRLVIHEQANIMNKIFCAPAGVEQLYIKY